MQDQWTAVERYFVEQLVRPDAALDAALADSDAAGLPTINVTANQGKLLHLLARSINARRILEIGTLGGYSAIWLARALAPGGRLITLELEPRHAEVARANLTRAGVAKMVEIRLGRAIDLLPAMKADGPFDLIFIDADKPGNADYFAWAMKLSRPGGMIIVDNVVRKGAVVDAGNSTAEVVGTRRLIDAMAAEKRASVTAMQTVSSKGYDGFAVAVVTE